MLLRQLLRAARITGKVLTRYWLTSGAGSSACFQIGAHETSKIDMKQKPGEALLFNVCALPFTVVAGFTIGPFYLPDVIVRYLRGFR